MDTARLRKAFKYPAEEDVDMSPEDMDEEEQEKLVQNLQRTEASANATYTILVTGLALIVALPFLWYLWTSDTASMALLCLLSVTSLLSSAYLMFFVPASTRTPTTTGPLSLAMETPRRPGFSPTPTLLSSEESPVNRYLPYLNAVMAVFLCLASWAHWTRSDASQGLWLLWLVPGVVFGMVVVARRSMSEIQTGLTELQGMRYEYKGA